MPLRNKNVPKAPESGTPEVGNQLVRMRSPVQIWVAAPKSRLNPLILAGFFYIPQLFLPVYFCGFSLTHTVTHTPKCPKRDRECQTGNPAFLPGVFAAFPALHDLRHKIPHRLRRPVLLLPGGVGVGTEGEARVVVSQHTADRFHVYTVLECQGCESMTQIVEANIGQSRLRQKFLQLPVGAVGGHRRFWPKRIVKNPGGRMICVFVPAAVPLWWAAGRFSVFPHRSWYYPLSACRPGYGDGI